MPELHSASSTRDRLLLLLEHPRCARELRERTRMTRKAVESGIQRLVRRRLVRCITPDVRQSRLYERTALGHLLAQEIRPTARRVSATGHASAYAWLQAGSYRRVILRHLAVPLTARELRKLANRQHPRLGANHVHAVLRNFAELGIALRHADSSWSLTRLGETLRDADLDGLLERPAIPLALLVRGLTCLLSLSHSE